MRVDIADYLSALLLVYMICIIGWIIISLVFSFGVRIPYNRYLNAVLDFMRDVTNPLLRIFRGLPLRVGPLDLTPLVAIIALQVVGGIVIGAIDPRP
jgi:YggT family protein